MEDATLLSCAAKICEKPDGAIYAVFYLQVPQHEDGDRIADLRIFEIDPSSQKWREIPLSLVFSSWARSRSSFTWPPETLIQAYYRNGNFTFYYREIAGLDDLIDRYWEASLEPSGGAWRLKRLKSEKEIPWGRPLQTRERLRGDLRDEVTAALDERIARHNG